MGSGASGVRVGKLLNRQSLTYFAKPAFNGKKNERIGPLLAEIRAVLIRELE